MVANHKQNNGIKSCIEFGSNIGANLKAIQTLLPNVEISAIEINHCACENYLKKFIKPENILINRFWTIYPQKNMILHLSRVY